jgi:hypothetical protein
MNDNKMTVKSWDEIAQLDDRQAENLNGGGYGYQSLSVYIAGGVGAVQVNGGDGTQLNIAPTGKAPGYRFGYYRY